MDIERTISELQAAGMTERQAEAFVRVLQQSLGSEAHASITGAAVSKPTGLLAPSDSNALDRQLDEFTSSLKRSIDAASRRIIAGTALFIILFYFLFRVTS